MNHREKHERLKNGGYMTKKVPRGTGVKALFASNLSRLRKEAGITQIALAKRTGLTHNFINDVENMKKWVSSETIQKLSEALDVEPMHFFVNNNLWKKPEDLKYLTIIGGIHKKVNKIFEECIIRETEETRDG